LAIFDPKGSAEEKSKLGKIHQSSSLRKFDDVTKMKEGLRSGNMLILRLELAFINSKKD